MAEANSIKDENARAVLYLGSSCKRTDLERPLDGKAIFAPGTIDVLTSRPVADAQYRKLRKTNARRVGEMELTGTPDRLEIGVEDERERCVDVFRIELFDILNARVGTHSEPDAEN